MGRNSPRPTLESSERTPLASSLVVPPLTFGNDWVHDFMVDGDEPRLRRQPAPQTVGLTAPPPPAPQAVGSFAPPPHRTAAAVSSRAIQMSPRSQTARSVSSNKIRTWTTTNVTLSLEAEKEPISHADLSTTILRQLLGDEVRKVVKEEIRSALAEHSAVADDPPLFEEAQHRASDRKELIAAVRAEMQAAHDESPGMRGRPKASASQALSERPTGSSTGADGLESPSGSPYVVYPASPPIPSKGRSFRDSNFSSPNILDEDVSASNMLGQLALEANATGNTKAHVFDKFILKKAIASSAGGKAQDSQLSTADSKSVQDKSYQSRLARGALVLLETQHKHPAAKTAIRCLAHADSKLHQMLDSLGVESAPYPSTRLRRLIEGPTWGSVVTCVVLLHCVFMVQTVNYQIANYRDGDNATFFLGELVFLAIYFVEFALKVYVYRWYYFTESKYKDNWLDFVLLVAGVANVLTVFLSEDTDTASPQTLGWVRMLRLLRLLKTIRVLRIALYFKSLRAIIAALTGSLWALSWSCAMLIIIYFMCSIVLCTRVADHLLQKGVQMSDSEIDELTKSFGSVSTSMLTLGLATTGGRDWGDTLSVLEQTDNFPNQVLFVLFIYFINIAVMNVIMGVFIEEAMKRLQPDTLERARQLAAQEEELESQLRSVCRAADMEGNNRLTVPEWQDSMGRGSLKELLEMLGFHAGHVHDFFMILSEESEAAGEPGVDIDRFVQGCLHLRGVATSFDMNTVLFKLGSVSHLMLQEISVLKEMQAAAQAAAPGQHPKEPL